MPPVLNNPHPVPDIAWSPSQFFIPDDLPASRPVFDTGLIVSANWRKSQCQMPGPIPHRTIWPDDPTSSLR